MSKPGHPQGHLHDQRHRVAELPAAQGHQDPRLVPTDDAVLKIFYLAIDNIGHHRGGELGSHTQSWKQALNAFAVAYPGRIPDTLS